MWLLERLILELCNQFNCTASATYDDALKHCCCKVSALSTLQKLFYHTRKWKTEKQKTCSFNWTSRTGIDQLDGPISAALAMSLNRKCSRKNNLAGSPPQRETRCAALSGETKHFLELRYHNEVWIIPIQKEVKIYKLYPDSWGNKCRKYKK